MQDRPLRGTSWVLESYGDSEPDDAVSSVPAGVRSTLRLDRVRAQVDFGCNGGGGEYALDGTILRLGNVAKTRILCRGARLVVEDPVGDVLATPTTTTWQVNGDVLTLSSSTGTLTYRARA